MVRNLPTRNPNAILSTFPFPETAWRLCPEKPDMLPVFPKISFATAKYAGYTVGQYMSDPSAMSQSVIAACERFGWDAVGITTDIMVGFPGETEEDFCDTLDLVRKAQFSSAFCFVYSPRKGTPASLMPQIDDAVKKDRITRLLACQNEVTKRISKTMVGKRYEVLVEGNNFRYKDTMCGRTESGRLVNFKCDSSLVGKFVTVKIERASSATLWGVVTEEE